MGDGKPVAECESWAWLEYHDMSIHHVWPSKILTELCSSDKFRRAIKNHEGEVVQVTITTKRIVKCLNT